MCSFSYVRSRSQQPMRANQRRVRKRAQVLELEQLEKREVLSTYIVGDSMSYTSLGAVPWTSLQPGDTVQIHWRPTAYQEKLLLSKSGTASQPIRIVGIPNASGQLPILDGQNATTSSQFQYYYTGMPNRGVIVVSLDKSQPYGTIPGYIQISNLVVQNGHAPYTYTDGSGATRSYTTNAASLFIERGQHILIHGCTITGSGNGLFVASEGDADTQSRDITVENCDIHGNGNVGSDLEHNVYTEAIGMVYQYNHFGQLLAGSGGNNLKDRSAGTVIRYNWFEGGAHIMDLVDPEDGAALEVPDPSFHKTLIYGNVLVDGPGDAVHLIQYGGDDGGYANYRTDTLYFYNNTVVIQRNQSEAWRTELFQLETNAQLVDARDNLIFVQAATAGQTPAEFSLLEAAGTAAFGVNWVSPGWLSFRTGVTATGTITGTSNFISNVQNDPGFVNLSTYDLHLKSTSQAVHRGEALNAAVATDYAVFFEYVAVAQSKPRSVVGTAIDLGAFEYGMLGSGNNEGLLLPGGVSSSGAGSGSGPGSGLGSGNNSGLLLPFR
jgi:hypothetical protein